MGYLISFRNKFCVILVALRLPSSTQVMTGSATMTKVATKMQLETINRLILINLCFTRRNCCALLQSMGNHDLL